MSDAAASVTFRFSRLCLDDLDSVFALHLSATSAVGRADLIKPESRAFFERILSGGGHVTGAFRDDDRLVGYGVLQLDLPPSEDARPLLGLAAGDSLAKLAGASVLPEIWGSGIHDALIAGRVEAAGQLGLRHLYATAAPGNARSWENLLAAGFAVRAIIEKYGGHTRYVLHRDLHARPVDTADGEWCAAEDVARQRLLIAAGNAATHWRKLTDGSRQLLYRARP